MKKFNFTLLCLLGVLVATVSCKKKNETVTPSSNTTPPASTIKSDTLSGSLKGTLAANKTYYLGGDVTVPKDDTLMLQAGSKVIALGNYEIYVRGVLISEGTQSSPAEFTIPDAAKSQSNNGLPAGYGGYWGGLNCDSAQSITIKWTKVEYMGGPDAGGGTRLGISCEYTQKLDVEDSWIRFCADDGLRIHGTVDCIVRRNTFEHCGGTGGESINIKQGATGDISYNIIWNSATKAIKLETDATVLFPQTSFNIYNNTVINSGFRNSAKPGFGTSIDLNTRANIWNNLYINCLRSIGIFKAADTTNSHYDYNVFFVTDTTVNSSGDPGAAYFTQPLNKYYYANDNGLVGKAQPHDVFISPVNASSQTVVTKMNNFSTDIPMIDWGTGSAPYNVTLASSSPAKNTGVASLPSGWTTYVNTGGTPGTITPTPSSTAGAKQASGGNLH